MDPDSPDGNRWLLVDQSPSEVCLNCHAGYISRTAGFDLLSPPPEVGAGNFVFLHEDNVNDGSGNAISGDATGHNIVAPSVGLGPDRTLNQSPSGNFPAARLGCTSCHDPHGNTDFRLLHGAGAAVQDGLFVFSNPAPVAIGLSIYHGLESNSKHTAYKEGMGRLCANCHGDFHRENQSLLHPSGGPLGTAISARYNAYNGTADLTGGTESNAYLALVPFEDPQASRTSRRGPTSTSQVSCVTCHRAHASSSPDAGRWDFNLTHLADDGLASGSAPIPNPYASDGQRSLCNTCHAKDEGDRAR